MDVDPVANQYYWHRFYHHQPDLNFESPDVRRSLLAVVNSGSPWVLMECVWMPCLTCMT